MAKSPYAEVPEPLRTHLPAMFASYPKLNLNHPSSWIVWTKDRVEAVNAEVCHAMMTYSSPGYEDLVTAVPKNDEISLEYLKMLIRGPFRSMSDLIKLDRVGKNYYLHCMSLGKWPANVLMNFCIASRVPIEFDFLLKRWVTYCDKGFDPTLAFLLGYTYGDIGDGYPYENRTFAFQLPGHIWFDAASDWNNIIQGLIQKPSASYKSNPAACRPTNSIWGHSQDYRKLMTMTDEQIAEFYNLPIKAYEPPKPPEPKQKPKNPWDLAFPGEGALNPVAQQVGMGNIHPQPNAIAADWQNVVNEILQAEPLHHFAHEVVQVNPGHVDMPEDWNPAEIEPELDDDF